MVHLSLTYLFIFTKIFPFKIPRTFGTSTSVSSLGLFSLPKEMPRFILNEADFTLSETKSSSGEKKYAGIISDNVCFYCLFMYTKAMCVETLIAMILSK